MAMKDLFKTKNLTRGVPVADSTTSHGTKAYALSERHALAQFAATGTMGSSFYATAEEQLDKVIKLAEKVDSEFVLKTAVYSRKYSFMKDMPALLLAIVAARGETGPSFKQAFAKVIDNGRMLRNFVQVIRSGQLGRSSFGTSVKKCIHQYLITRTSEQLFKDSIGNEPTLADIIRMVHPKPESATKEALYAYLLGREYSKRNLPTIVKSYEAFKEGKRETVPEVDFRMLTSLTLTEADWKDIAKQLPWHALRMNLNTLARHGVFNDAKVTKAVANKLRDPESIAKAKVFPYQLMMAYRATSSGTGIPAEITEALQDALDASLDNVPELAGNTVIAVDVSGSMGHSVTGSGPNASQVRNIEVAALIAAAILRKNKSAVIIPFANDVKRLGLNPRDSVVTNAKKLTDMLGGGTNCSAPLQYARVQKIPVDTFITVSDNESWMDRGGNNASGTATMEQYQGLKQLNPKLKMVCIDISPNDHTQAKERADILNVGGFSDNVFEVISLFVQNGINSGHWVSIIDGVRL